MIDLLFRFLLVFGILALVAINFGILIGWTEFIHRDNEEKTDDTD